MFIVEGSRKGQPYQLPVTHFDEAICAAAWAVNDNAFSPRRILSDGGRELVSEKRLAGLIGKLIASGLPLI